jgi:putative transposase
LAVKCVKQTNCHLEPLLPLMKTFRQMVNDCISIGVDNNISTMKKLCNIAYSYLGRYDIISYYKLCAISHAAGILTNRKKSIRQGLNPRQPYATRPMLISCYGFEIINGTLKVSLGNKQYSDISLNSHVRKVLSEPCLKICSFTLTCDTVK